MDWRQKRNMFFIISFYDFKMSVHMFIMGESEVECISQVTNTDTENASANNSQTIFFIYFPYNMSS